MPLPSPPSPDHDSLSKGRGPLAAALRFAASVPGQILVNTAAFTLPDELRMRDNWQVLDVGCVRGSLVRVLADRAGLQTPPMGVDASAGALASAQRDMDAEGGPPVHLARGLPTALPCANDAFHLVISGHMFKHFSDDDLRCCLVEVWRVLKPGGLFLAWEYAPTASRLLDRWNRWVLTREAPLVRLRGYRELRDLARESGFGWVENAHLRPFLLPPIPRVSLIMGKAPEGWRSRDIEGREVVQFAPEET